MGVYEVLAEREGDFLRARRLALPIGLNRPFLRDAYRATCASREKERPGVDSSCWRRPSLRRDRVPRDSYYLPGAVNYRQTTRLLAPEMTKIGLRARETANRMPRFYLRIGAEKRFPRRDNNSEKLMRFVSHLLSWIFFFFFFKRKPQRQT